MLYLILKKLTRLARQSIVLSLLFYLSLLVSIFVYYLFYNWYVPKAKLEKPIEFELRTLNHKRVASLGINNNNGDNYDAAQQNELIASVNLFDRIGDSLHYGQEYSLTLVLDLPESDWNFELGMFGITVDIVDIEGRKIVTYKTMGTLVYKSVLLRCLTTLFYFPSYLLGRFEQKQTLALTLKENFIDNAYMPANKIIIRIHDKLQYYSAMLNIEAKFSGFKFFLYRWFFTSSMIICLGLTLLTFLILLTSCFDIKSMLYLTDSKKSKSRSLAPIRSNTNKSIGYHNDNYEKMYEIEDDGDQEDNKSSFSVNDNESTCSNEDSSSEYSINMKSKTKNDEPVKRNKDPSQDAYFFRIKKNLYLLKNFYSKKNYFE